MFCDYCRSRHFFLRRAFMEILIEIQLMNLQLIGMCLLAEMTLCSDLSVLLYSHNIIYLSPIRYYNSPHRTILIGYLG